MKLKLWQKGFTLAEVLITLTIIGVIAALTIPNLMRKYADHATVASVKEARALLTTAAQKAIAEYGPMDDWWDNSLSPYGSVLPHRQYASKIFSQLKTTNDCKSELDTNNVTRECDGYMDPYYGNNARQYKNMNNTTRGFISKQLNGGMWAPAVLQNGMFIWITNVKNLQGVRVDYKTYGNVIVDVDGYKKGPNVYGLDTFSFLILENGVLVPDGIFDTWSWITPQANACSKTSGIPEACTVWVIMNGNMDYKYKEVDLSPYKQNHR